jgi:SAM-dependent methyltransferase
MTTFKELAKMAVPVSRLRHDRQHQQVQSLESRLAALEATCSSQQERIAMLESSLLYYRSLTGALHTGSPVSLAPNQTDYSLDGCFQKLKALAPVAYSHWHRLLEVNAHAYVGFPVDSCSVAGHPVAEHFRGFLHAYLTGPVLDIGCGPQPVPRYLADYPVELIAGLDPLAPPTPHPFAFVQGTAEFLPWPDATFDAVIASTSLDHILLPDLSMQEICRVLKPNGHFVTWVSFVPGAKDYEPYSPEAAPIDAYHLFHFDRPAFETLMQKYFVARERFCLDGESWFWSFQKKA